MQPPPGGHTPSSLLPRLGGILPLLLHRVLHVLQGDHHHHGHSPLRRSHTQQGVPQSRLGQPHLVRDVRHLQRHAGRWKGIQSRGGQLPERLQTRDGPHISVQSHRRHPPPVQRG